VNDTKIYAITSLIISVLTGVPSVVSRFTPAFGARLRWSFVSSICFRVFWSRIRSTPASRPVRSTI